MLWSRGFYGKTCGMGLHPAAGSEFFRPHIPVTRPPMPERSFSHNPGIPEQIFRERITAMSLYIFKN